MLGAVGILQRDPPGAEAEEIADLVKHRGGVLCQAAEIEKQEALAPENLEIPLDLVGIAAADDQHRVVLERLEQGLGTGRGRRGAHGVAMGGGRALHRVAQHVDEARLGADLGDALRYRVVRPGHRAGVSISAARAQETVGGRGIEANLRIGVGETARIGFEAVLEMVVKNCGSLGSETQTSGRWSSSAAR
jgi:hypothetical protein